MEDLAPFLMVTTIVFFVFTYQTIKLFVVGPGETRVQKRERKQREKHIRRHGKPPEPSYDDDALNGLLDRAHDLTRRVQTLEEIISKEEDKPEVG